MKTENNTAAVNYTKVINTAKAELKEAKKVYEESPNMTSLEIVGKLMKKVKELETEQAKAEGKYNPKEYMPYRTEVTSRLYTNIIWTTVKRLGYEILKQGRNKITIKGKKDAELCTELQAMGLTPDEDYEIRSWQMTQSAATEYYKKVLAAG